MHMSFITVACYPGRHVLQKRARNILQSVSSGLSVRKNGLPERPEKVRLEHFESTEIDRKTCFRVSSGTFASPAVTPSS